MQNLDRSCEVLLSIVRMPEGNNQKTPRVFVVFEGERNKTVRKQNNTRKPKTTFGEKKRKNNFSSEVFFLLDFTVSKFCIAEIQNQPNNLELLVFTQQRKKQRKPKNKQTNLRKHQTTLLVGFLEAFFSVWVFPMFLFFVAG